MIRCCNRPAVYHCLIDMNPVGVQEKYERDYCADHIGELVAGIAHIISKPDLDGVRLHEVLEVEHVNA